MSYSQIKLDIAGGVATITLQFFYNCILIKLFTWFS